MSAQDVPNMHGNMLHIAKGVNDVALAAHLPVQLIAQVFLEDENQRNDVINVLNAVRSMSSAPLMQERRRQGMQELMHNPNKRDALQTAGRDIGGEYLRQSTPLLEDILIKLLTQ